MITYLSRSERGKVKCYVCGRYFGFMGWAKHVKKEKKIHGENIYRKLREERERKKDQSFFRVGKPDFKKPWTQEKLGGKK